MTWDWGAWLVVDAALLMAATVVTLMLFARDLYRGLKDPDEEDSPPPEGPEGEGLGGGSRHKKGPR